tara:strand:- start:82 stop:273 length:192 start_codon:yes stop_codon:yes gene_type:complete
MLSSNHAPIARCLVQTVQSAQARLGICILDHSETSERFGEERITDQDGRRLIKGNMNRGLPPT